jgi:hypothetical protein
VNWEAIGAVAELLGATGVIISLVYLANQLRSNSRVVRANSAWDAEIHFASANNDNAADPRLASLIQRVMTPGSTIEDLDESDRAQIWFAALAAVQTCQAQYFLKKEGCLPEEIWEYRVAWFRSFILIPVIQSHWTLMKEQNLLARGFIEEIEREKGLAPYSIDAR